MKRRLFCLAAALSLLLSVAAAAAWVTSHSRTPRWHLIATAHSADLTRVDRGRRSALFTTTPGWSNAPHHGFWDAWWVLSRAGRLTLLTQVVDYEGTLGRVHASPPSLIVDVPGQGRQRAVVFGRMPGAGSWHSDAQVVDGAAGPVSARAWMVTVPHWIIVLIGLPMPLLWLRRRADTQVV